MNIQRFTAPTAREALAKARMAFGDSTLILSNKPIAGGIEVMATSEDTLAALDQSARPALSTARPAMPATAVAATRASEHTTVKEDADQLTMSTLSFQDYVRERMLQRRQEGLRGKSLQDTPPAPSRASYKVVPPDVAPQRPATAVATRPAAAAPAAREPVLPQGLVSELNSMKELIEERFSTMAWLGQAKQNPIRAHLTLKLIRAGYSPALARAILSMMPDDANPAEAMQWMLRVFERNLKTDSRSPALQDEGGVYALVGTTGVGKTTTIAKLAGLCVRAYGANSVGLITLDSYRVGAHEQLRAYGRMLGVVTHMATDRAALQDLLGLLGNKKMILIDTTGLAPRDPRKHELMDVLDLPQIKRLLVLNAASHGDTQDDTIAAFRASGAQQTLLTKVDEAVKLGPVLDSAIRHQLVLRGVSTGQRVPEDWERADAGVLVRQSMRSAGKSAFDPKMDDLGLYFAQPAPHTTGPQGRLHA